MRLLDSLNSLLSTVDKRQRQRWNAQDKLARERKEIDRKIADTRAERETYDSIAAGRKELAASKAVLKVEKQKLSKAKGDAKQKDIIDIVDDLFETNKKTRRK